MGKNGRLAMLAITGFCFQEVLTHQAVIDQTPFFFKPIWDTLTSSVPDYVIPDGSASESITSSVEPITSGAVEATTITPPPVVPEIVTPPPPVVPEVVTPPPPLVDIAPPVVNSAPVDPLLSEFQTTT